MAIDKQNMPQKLVWPVPEYRRPERGRRWYIIAGIFLFLCLFFSFFSFSGWKLTFLGANSNFLFALILIISSIIIIINDGRPALMVNIYLESEGMKIGNKFYDYDGFKHFAIIYKPKQSVKNLYFEFKNSFRPRLSIPLRHMDPILVRNFLLRYLDEDLERTDIPLSEQLTKLFKL